MKEGYLDLQIGLTQPHKKIRLIQIMFACAVESKVSTINGSVHSLIQFAIFVPKKGI